MAAVSGRHFLEKEAERALVSSSNTYFIVLHPLIASLSLGMFPGVNPCKRCSANPDLVSFFYGNAWPLAWLCDWLWHKALEQELSLIAWGSGYTADRCQDADVLYWMYGVWQISTYQAEILTLRSCCRTETLTDTGTLLAVFFMSILIRI